MLGAMGIEAMGMNSLDLKMTPKMGLPKGQLREDSGEADTRFEAHLHVFECL